MLNLFIVLLSCWSLSVSEARLWRTTGRSIMSHISSASSSASSIEMMALKDASEDETVSLLQDMDSFEEDLASIAAVTVLRGGAGSATVASSVFNLVNNVAGAGILTLAAGMAAGTGWVPSVIICVILGMLSGHTFGIVGEACELTGEDDFKGLWSTTIGEKSKFLVDSMIAFMCLACCVIYSGILGDVSSSLLKQARVSGQITERSPMILAVTLVLLPLCLLKDLSALAFTSILGFAAIISTVAIIVFRALDGTYALGDETGKGIGFFVDERLPVLPSFEKASLWNIDFSSLVLASNLGLAYIAHYNAPTFYRSLKDTNSKRFRGMVNISFAVLVSLYIITMAAGFSTFGDSCAGNILLNYHPNDALGIAARLATFFSILFGYPLVANGARESLLGVASSLNIPLPPHFLLVTSILTLVTGIAIAVPDVSLVVGVTGAALGSLIVFIIPPLIYTSAVRLTKGASSADYKKSVPNLMLVPFGIFIGALGVYMTIKESK